jgi:hypothetical protein
MEAVSGLMQIGQFICVATGQFADAGAIGMHGPALATEVVKIADASPKFAKRIDLLIEVGPYAGLVAAGLPFAIQILVNHGVFKPEQFANAGILTPETLESEMKMTLMRQQMEAQQRQMAMEEEMRQMQEEMQAAHSAEEKNETVSV